METKYELTKATIRLAKGARTSEAISAEQVRMANSFLAFKITEDQLARINSIINE